MKPRLTAGKVVTVSFLVDIVDVVINLFVALLSGSVIMFAEFLEGGADFISAGFLLVGLKRARRPADRNHPFGHGKEVYFWTLLSALIMFVIASSFSFYFGLQRFLHPEPIQNIYLAFAALLIAVATNGYAFSLSYKRLVGRRNPFHLIRIFFQSSLIETKNTFVLDLIGALAAGTGLISLTLYQVTGARWFDGLGAMVIGLILAILAFLLILGIKDVLVGKSASESVQRRIKEAALDIPQVRQVLDLRTMQIGSERLLVNLEVHMKGKLTTEELEMLIDKIKENVRREVPTVRHIQVELETPDHTVHHKS